MSLRPRLRGVAHAFQTAAAADARPAGGGFDDGEVFSGKTLRLALAAGAVLGGQIVRAPA